MYKNLLKILCFSPGKYLAGKKPKWALAIPLAAGCAIWGDACAVPLAPEVKEFCDRFYVAHNVTDVQTADREFLANKIQQGKVVHARLGIAIDFVGGVQKPLQEMRRLYQTALTGKGYDPIQLDIEYQILASHATSAYSAMMQYLQHMVEGAQFATLCQMIEQLPQQFSVGRLSCQIGIQEVEMILMDNGEHKGLATLLDSLIIGLISTKHALEYDQGFFELAQTEPCLARIVVKGLGDRL